jgi:DNA-binding response OmpR family regulator
VLVVDDDLSLQDLFRKFLKQIGFSRVVVGTAKEAINSLRAEIRSHVFGLAIAGRTR